MNSFSSKYKRKSMDLGFLLNQSIKIVGNLFLVKKEGMYYLEELSVKIKHFSNLKPDNLEWGYCYGDLHRGDAHFTKDF
ncbi:hypothetical protein ACSLGG_31240 (plasmid) [Bacillus mycoides]|uniref:hypothetical protein n=1 Tax=Bacillus mycoides TaxID=1405 RepID=UPI003F7505DF